MADRPTIEPGFLADVIERAPKRLVRKLDKQPALTDDWTWNPGSPTVVDTGSETVTINGPVADDDGIACSCLLQPRCLHVLAVARALPLVPASDSGPQASKPESESGTDPAADYAVVTAAQRQAGARAQHVGSALVTSGIAAADTAAEADLLRIVHQCRTVGLHTAAGAAVAVLRSIRSLRENEAEFDLGLVTRTVGQLLVAAAAVSDGYPEAIGFARRTYHDIGSVRLYGLCSEPVVTASGYAGCVTMLVDDDGLLYTVADVMPGDASRASAAYRGAAAIGDTSLSHAELSRSGLFIQRATASPDGRLGRGAGVAAVRADGAGWGDEPIAALFRQPLGRQLDRYFEQLGRSVERRQAGWDLLFIDGTIAPGGPAVRCGSAGSDPPTRLELTAAAEGGGSAHGANLGRIGAGTGRSIRLIARPEPRTAGHVHPVAFGPGAGQSGPEQSGWSLPSAWGDRLSAGFDALQGSYLVGSTEPADDYQPGPPPTGAARPDPFAPLRRRVERAVLGGSATVVHASRQELDHEVRRLVESMLATGGEALAGMVEAAATQGRDQVGRGLMVDPTVFGRAWLRAATYLDRAELELSRRLWLDQVTT